MLILKSPTGKILPQSAITIYKELKRLCNPNTKISNAQLSDNTGYSKTIINKRIQELEEYGYITAYRGWSNGVSIRTISIVEREDVQ